MRTHSYPESRTPSSREVKKVLDGTEAVSILPEIKAVDEYKFSGTSDSRDIYERVARDINQILNSVSSAYAKHVKDSNPWLRKRMLTDWRFGAQVNVLRSFVSQMISDLRLKRGEAEASQAMRQILTVLEDKLVDLKKHY